MKQLTISNTKFFSVLWITIMLFICKANAQVEVTGILKDNLDNSNLLYANITLLELQDSTFVNGTTSDSRGQFSLKADLGAYWVRVSYLGYETQYIALNIDKSMPKWDMGILKLHKSDNQLEEVVVAAKKPMYAYENDKKVYNVSEDPSVQTETATEVLKNSPGVFVDMDGNITLRGVSGVAIWINNKPSKITGNGLKEFLKQLPANTIEKIEVITNPSAKYGAEGTGGIINIVTREKIKRNQLLSLGTNVSTLTSISPWASYVYSNEKLTLNAYLGWGKSNQKYNSNSSGFLLDKQDTVCETFSDFQQKSSQHYGYGGSYLQYDIDSSNNISAWVNFNLFGYNASSESYNQRLMPSKEQFLFNTTNDYSHKGQNWNTGLGFEHLFKRKGHKINTEAYIGGYSENNVTKKAHVYDVQTWNNRQYINDSPAKTKWSGVDISYENPLGKKRSLEAGAEFSFNIDYDTSNVKLYDFTSQDYIYNNLYSNKSNTENLGAETYLSYADTLWLINYKVGLRHQYQRLVLKSVALNDNLLREFSDFFPSIHLSTQTKNNDNLTLSYSRRVEYPSRHLDPFVNRIDPYYITSGNPYLNPAFTNSFEFGYAHFFENGSNIMANLYHRRTRLEISNIKQTVFDTYLNQYTAYSTYINAGKNLFTGADLTLTWLPLPNYRIMLNTNLYNQKIYSDIDKYSIDKSHFSWNSKLVLIFNFKPIRLNITGVYRSKSVNLMGEFGDVYFVNASASADFFKRKLSLWFSVMDIFNTSKQQWIFNTPDYKATSSSKQISQYLTLGITFRIGKLELESKQKSMSRGQ